MGTMSSPSNRYLPHLPQNGKNRAKRRMTAERAVEWAWRDELPKAPRLVNGPDGFLAAWRKVSEFGERLSLVDMTGVNQWGCVPDLSADRYPHPDAEAIAEAVHALDGWTIGIPDDWSPAPELDAFAGLAARAVSIAARRAMVKPVSLIVSRRAILGIDPADWTIGPTEIGHEKAANGRDKWIVRATVDTIVGSNPDGSDRTVAETVELPGTGRNGKPLPGAYRKPYLDPDPVDPLTARAEHEIWHAALTALAEMLAGRLETIDMLPPETPARPWTAPMRIRRVLDDLSGGWLKNPKIPS